MCQNRNDIICTNTITKTDKHEPSKTHKYAFEGHYLEKLLT